MLSQECNQKKLHVIGNYRFNGKVLGKGNFARVEEASHTILNIKVAIKIMDINQIKEDYVIRNLSREAKLMAKLNHPCICALYQTMQRSDKIYYLVTELASGGDLCTFVKEQRGGCLEERPARIYARQFVSAISHMHNVGVVHRDLKMENVMLNSAQTQIKIVDFGLSNFFSLNEPLKTHCGSPEYAAPELFVTGMKYGPEVDLWSLGIIFYGMVVGQLPFVSNRSEQVSSQERRKKLVAQINKGLGSAHKRALIEFSSDFRHLIYRMLVPDITKRISIRELLMHPFITDKGSKLIRVNPMKKLDTEYQLQIISHISELIHQTNDQVMRLIKKEAFGKIGGLYNILAHKFALSRLSADGITRNTTFEIELRDSKAKAKRLYNLINEDHPSAGAVNDYTPRIIVQERKKTKPLVFQQTAKFVPSEISSSRPKTVQETKKKTNYKDVKLPLTTRRVCSAGITPKTNRSTTVASPIAVKVSSSMKTRINNKDVVKRLYPAVDIEQMQKKRNLPSKLIGDLAIKKSVAQNNLKVPPIPLMETHHQRFSNKSEKLPIQIIRPSTTTSHPGTVRKSLLNTTQSDSKASTVRPQTTTSSTNGYRPITRLLKISRSINTTNQPKIVEKSTALAHGDIMEKTPIKFKKPIIYDPIARSIAGYVCNNVPNLTNFK